MDKDFADKFVVDATIELWGGYRMFFSADEFILYDFDDNEIKRGTFDECREFYIRHREKKTRGQHE